MELLRYVLPHFCAGGVGGAVASLALIATNRPFRSLVLNTDGGWLAIGLLVSGLALMFATIAAGCAIMHIGEDDP